MANDEQSLFDSLDAPVTEKVTQDEWSLFQSLVPANWKNPHRSDPYATDSKNPLVHLYRGARSGSLGLSRDIYTNWPSFLADLIPGASSQGLQFATDVGVAPLREINREMNANIQRAHTMPAETYSPQWFVNSLSEMAPALGTQMVVGAGFGKPGYAVTGFIQSASNQYGTAYDRKLASGLSEEEAGKQAAKEALAVGVMTAATDALTFDAVMGKVKTKGGVREIINKSPVGRILKGGAVEGGQEGLQSFLTLGIESISDLEDYMTSKNFQEQVLPSIALGAVAGTAMRGVAEGGAKAFDLPTVEASTDKRYKLTRDDAFRLVRENPEAAQRIINSKRAGVNDFAIEGVERGTGNRKAATAQRKKFQETVAQELESLQKFQADRTGFWKGVDTSGGNWGLAAPAQEQVQGQSQEQAGPGYTAGKIGADPLQVDFEQVMYNRQSNDPLDPNNLTWEVLNATRGLDPANAAHAVDKVLKWAREGKNRKDANEILNRSKMPKVLRDRLSDIIDRVFPKSEIEQLQEWYDNRDTTDGALIVRDPPIDIGATIVIPDPPAGIAKKGTSARRFLERTTQLFIGKKRSEVTEEELAITRELILRDPEKAKEIVARNHGETSADVKSFMRMIDGYVKKELDSMPESEIERLQRWWDSRGTRSNEIIPAQENMNAAPGPETPLPGQDQANVPQTDAQNIDAGQIPPGQQTIYRSSPAGYGSDIKPQNYRINNQGQGIRQVNRVNTVNDEERTDGGNQPPQSLGQQTPNEIGRPTAGMGVSIPMRVGKRRLTAQIMRSLKRWGTSLGLSNADTRRLVERKAANMNAEQIQAQSEHARYIKAVKDTFGKPLKKLDAATKEELGRVVNDRNAMYGNNPSQYTNLPEKILVPLRAFRRHIDRLSQELIDIGVLSEELEIVIDENTGEYTVRSYQMWDDPTYGIHKIPKQILDDAIKWFQDNLENGSPTDYDYVKNLIDLYFNSKGQKNIKLSGPPGRNDLTSLMKRKDIPEPLRKLMGEHKDPGFNAVRTITKLAYMVETARFQRDLLELGEGRFLFSQGDPNLPPGMESLGSSPSLGVLANYAADPGLAEVIRGGLEAQNKVSNFVWRYLSLGSAFSKLAATKYSPASGGRNAISGLNFMVKNGIFEPYRAGKAFWKSLKFHYRDAGVLLKGKAFDQKNLELAKEYQNVVGEEVRLNELKHFLKVAASKPEGWVTKFFDIDGAINATENPAWEAVLRSARYVDDIAAKFWLTGDTLWKIAQYEVEKDRLRSYRKDLSESEVKDLAADIVKDTTPTYSRVLQWVQALRKNPLIAPFPSFTGEIYRNNLNISKQAFQEWRYAAKEIQKSGVTDPAEFMAKFVKHPATYIGFSRFMGLMAGVAGFAWVMNTVGKALTGVTDEEEKALGEMDPEWAKGNWWTYNPFDPEDEQGNPNRVDISYIHTDNTVIKPWIALLRTGDDVEFMKQLIDPFTGADIFFDAFSEAGQNWDSERKRPVYNESLYEFPVNPQSAMHVGKSLSPGLARSYDQISDAMQGKVRNDSKILSVPQAISSSLGLKIYSNDPLTQIGYAASDFKRKERENKSVFQTMARLAGDVSTEELVDAFVTMERARQNNFERMEKKFNAAITLRNPGEVVTATAEPLSDEDQERFMAGLFKPYEPTDAFLKSVPQRKRAQVVEAIQLGRERIAAQQSEADRALAQPPAQ